MLLPDFTLARPRSLAEAAQFASQPHARIVAGGTGLIPNLRLGLEAPQVLVSLDRVDGLRQITLEKGHLRIGACVTLARLATQLGAGYAALREAAAAVGAPAHRVAGTLGGNLCLDTRCLYYNQSEHWRASNGYCLKAGGEICHVAPRGKVCRAAFSGDLAAAALALDAEVEIARHGREVEVRPLAKLYRDDGARPLVLEPGQIVTAIRLPPAAGRSGYAKARNRGAIDFPLAGVAMAAALREGRIAHLRVALTGTNSCPLLLAGLEPLIGAVPDEKAAAAVAKAVERQAKPLRTGVGGADYRRRVAMVLARRLLARLTKGERT